MKKTLIVFTFCMMAAGISARAADAKENWDKLCAKCHGADGKGETKLGKKWGLKDYTNAKVQAEMKDEDIVKIIKQGKKEGDKSMKAFADLTDAEVKGLVTYIRNFKK